ncbi:hypothetical protein ES703_120147 [subsurface metagenome]
MQSGQHNRVDDLARMHKLSRRTIFRDLKELRAIGVPYHYDAKTGAYTTEPEFFVPPINLNLQEAFSLLLLARKASNQVQSPFRTSLLRAALKVESNLPCEVKRYCNTAFRNIHVKARPQARMDLLNEIFGQLMIAILRKRVVSIRYYLPREQKSIVIHLDPYHLRYNENQWYVFGKSDLDQDVRAFKLNRMKELNALDKCFVNEKKFDIGEYLGRAWSMVPEGRLYNIKLRFSPQVAHDVAEVQWHSTQTVTFEGDGSVIIEFRVDGLNEITWWILSYGDQVQVLAPRILREKIIKIAQKIVRANQQKSPVI